MKQSLLKTYVALVVAAAAALAGWLGGGHELTVGGGLLAVLMWTFVVGSQSVAFPKHRVQITAADCFLFYCLVSHGAVAAMIAAFIGTLGAMQLGDRKVKPHQAAFNLGVVPLAAGLGGYAYELLRQESSLLVAMLAAAAIFAVSNTLLVTVALKIEGRANLVRTLKGTVPGFAASVLVTATAGGMLAELAAAGSGDWTVAAVVGICFLVGMTISAFRDRSEKAETATSGAPSVNEAEPVS